MTTHGHYVSELNILFGDNWIITDTLAYHLLCVKYKIKSVYNKNINNINIFYYKQNFNKKIPQSCDVNYIDDKLIINITKPAFDSNAVIKYKITATKIDYDLKYIIINNLKIIHPEYHPEYHPEHLLNHDNNKEICEKIIEKINKTIIKYNKQIEYLNTKESKDYKLISYLQNEIDIMNNNNVNYNEPSAKKILLDKK